MTQSDWQPQNEAVSEGIRVAVDVMYVPHRSEPHGDGHFFAYRITITNEGEQPAQLIDRHWQITNGFGQTTVVEGPGVVGEQPEIEPGDAFQYTSYCPLPTEHGTMQGYYGMTRPDGETFKAEVPLFALTKPGLVN